MHGHWDRPKISTWKLNYVKYNKYKNEEGSWNTSLMNSQTANEVKKLREPVWTVGQWRQQLLWPIETKNNNKIIRVQKIKWNTIKLIQGKVQASSGTCLVLSRIFSSRFFSNAPSNTDSSISLILDSSGLTKSLPLTACCTFSRAASSANCRSARWYSKGKT